VKVESKKELGKYDEKGKKYASRSPILNKKGRMNYLSDLEFQTKKPK
jgi:hypothetical protein